MQKEKYKNGDIFFTTSKSLLSRIIRFFTGAKVSHTGVIIELEGYFFAVEMLNEGCIMRPADSRFKNVEHYIFRTIPPKDFKTKVLNDVGNVPYDWHGLFLSMFMRTKGQEKICSEWVAYILNIKLPYLNREITPSDLINIYSAKKW